MRFLSSLLFIWLLSAGATRLLAQTPTPRSPCNCRACAGATALLDNPLANGNSLQDIRVAQLGSNRVAVSQHIACSPLTSEVLLQRWSWDGKPGISALEQQIFAEHYTSNGPMVQIRSGVLASFFETTWAGRAPKGAAQQQAAAMSPQIMRFLFPQAEALSAPLSVDARIGFLDPEQTRVLLSFSVVYQLPAAHDFAVVETRLMSRTSRSQFAMGLDDKAARAALLEVRQAEAVTSVRRVGLPLVASPSK